MIQVAYEELTVCSYTKHVARSGIVGRSTRCSSHDAITTRAIDSFDRYNNIDGIVYSWTYARRWISSPVSYIVRRNGGCRNNRKSDTDEHVVDVTKLQFSNCDTSRTITPSTGDYEYQVSLHIRCLRYDTVDVFRSPANHRRAQTLE